MVRGLVENPEAADGAYQSAQQILREAGAFEAPHGSLPAKDPGEK